MHNYQYGYGAPQYGHQYYGGVAPNTEYLEQRRISMPMNHYAAQLEQPGYQQVHQQSRSNSMADVMNPRQFNGGKSHNSGPPPGLNRLPAASGRLKVTRNFSGHDASGDQPDIQGLTGDFAKMHCSNIDFSKMDLSQNQVVSGMQPSKVRAATGEMSAHSNSTIKEEDFDSEKEAHERDPNSSSACGTGPEPGPETGPEPGPETSQYVFGNATHTVSATNTKSLAKAHMARNQKRRESHQIPMKSLEDKKLLKSPMKSSSVAWVPNDSRTSSMPNIFQPFGGHDNFYPQEHTAYYNYNAHDRPQQMMGYNQPAMGANPGHPRPQYGRPGVQNGPSLGGPAMPDYDYDQRRNSGTTGGSSNLGKSLKFAQNKPKHKKPASKAPKDFSALKSQNNKSRRSSTHSVSIPSSDKSIVDCKGQIPALAKNQQGSKYLQRVLAKASPDVLEFIVVEAGDSLHELMVDSYGNYFCQKLLQSCSSKQRLYLLTKISPHIVNISCDKRGTHSMQSLIQLINMQEEEDTLEHALREHVISLSFDPNGTHVLQKVILTVKVAKLDYIFEACFDKLLELSLDSNGLCVVKKIIARFSGTPDKKALLVEKLSED